MLIYHWYIKETAMLTPEQEVECQKLKAIFQERAGMTQKEFVAKYKLGTPANLGQYLNGRRPIPVVLAAKLASILGVKISDFSPRLEKEAAASGIFTNVNIAEPQSTRLIPVLSYVQAGNLTNYDSFDRAAGEFPNCNFISVDADYPECFALIIKGNSMEPLFKEDDIIIVEPYVDPHPGDFVVARRDSDFSFGTETTFKKYRTRGINRYGNPIFELVPLNEDYPTFNSETDHLIIVGVMIEHRRKYRIRI